MQDISQPVGASHRSQIRVSNNSQNLTSDINNLIAEFPELQAELKEISTSSEKSIGSGFIRLFRTTSRQEVGAIALKLAAGTALTAEDVTKLTNIAADPTKKGAASAKQVLEANTVGKLAAKLAKGTELNTQDETELTAIADNTTKKGSASAKQVLEDNTVGKLAAKLAKGTELDAEDVKRLTTIADNTTKKGSASAKQVLEDNKALEANQVLEANTVDKLAAKLAQGMQLDAEDVKRLTAIADDPRKKGSASAQQVLEDNTVGKLAAKLAKGTQLEDKEVDKLNAIAANPTKKGSAELILEYGKAALQELSESAEQNPLTEEDLALLKLIPPDQLFKHGSAKLILKYGEAALQELSKSAEQNPLTKKDLALLKLIPQAQLFTHGSAKLIYKYASSLGMKEQLPFVQEFTKSQKIEDGSDKHDAVFKMALKDAIATGGEPGAFMRATTLYSRLGVARVSHYADSSTMVKFSNDLIKSLETKPELSTAITAKAVTPEQGAQIATVVSEFFTTSIATLTLSPKYVADLKALLAEVGTHFETSKETACTKVSLKKDLTEVEKKYVDLTPKEIALAKFQQFASNYMLRNFNPLMTQPGSDGKTSPVGLYLTKITQNAANMVFFGYKEEHLPITLNPSVLTGIDSLLAMGVLNGLFTPEEVAVIGQEIAALKVKADELKVKADALKPKPENLTQAKVELFTPEEQALINALTPSSKPASG